MKSKKNLNPDWRIIAITLLVSFLTIFYNTRTETLSHPATRYYQGFPFEWWFYDQGGVVTGFELLLNGNIIPLGFVLNMTFWFIISYLLFWSYDKVKKLK